MRQKFVKDRQTQGYNNTGIPPPSPSEWFGAGVYTDTCSNRLSHLSNTSDPKTHLS